jgi:GcvH upstream region-like protein
MLNFFRRHQRYFFLVITFFVIISFSFFGTYSTVGSNNWRDQIAFKAIDGHEFTRSEVDEMAQFLTTDSQDKVYYRGDWGPNFLNDGVIQKDFLETGLAQELFCYYRKELAKDLKQRLEKEKRYSFYTHPQAPFLNVENAWNYLMPDMATYFNNLRAAKAGNTPQAFDARVKLFLAEKKFPGASLRQVLRYQERQYAWLRPDPNLDHTDLSLFNYHTLEDWFGPRFTRLVSEFIMNAAILAEAKGYQVTRAEVLADLMRNTEVSYQQNKQSPYLGVKSSSEYFHEQLRQLNMDQNRAIKIWGQVLLFRRYFQDAGHSALVDTFQYQQFQDYAKESVTVDLYRLPSELHFGDYPSLQRFEVYLSAVSKRPKDDVLGLPTQFLSASEVSKNYPELVQKRYLLEVIQVDKKNFYPRIGLKEMWNWEIEDNNWSILQKRFPDLGMSEAKTHEERLAVLDGLDKVTRSKVDGVARSAIIENDPNWLNKAIEETKPEQMTVGLRIQGGKFPFEGVESKDQRQELIRLLDQAPLNTFLEPLQAYTADGQHYYRIKILERHNQAEVLTFAESNQDGTLDQVRDRLLEAYYMTIREQNPTLYQKPSDQSWKPFKEVKELVTDQYFDKILKAIQQTQGREGTRLTKEQAASLRFSTYFAQLKAKIEKDPVQSLQLIRPKEDQKSGSLLAQADLVGQWRLIKTEETLNRTQTHQAIDAEQAFQLPVQSWSTIRQPANGDLAFFQITQKSNSFENSESSIAERTRQAYFLLSADAQRILLHQIMKEIVAKQAMSLDFLNTPEEQNGDLEESPMVHTEEIL